MDSKLYNYTAFENRVHVTLPTKSDLDSVKNEHQHSCIHCGTPYTKYDALLEHLKTCKLNDNNTPAAAASNETKTSATGQRHMCMECGEVLSTAYSLKRHNLTHTGHKTIQM